MKDNQPRRVRGKSIRTQLQQVLNEAACANGADGDTKKLIGTRIVALGKLLRFDRIRKLKAECDDLRTENERLNAEIIRLRQAQGQSQLSSLSDLDTKLREIDQQYYARKEETHV